MHFDGHAIPARCPICAQTLVVQQLRPGSPEYHAQAQGLRAHYETHGR